jgi:hypothetical protein
MDGKDPVVGIASLERASARQRNEAVARRFRFVGRLCLLGAAISGGLEIFNPLPRQVPPPGSLRTLFDLSPYYRITSNWFIQTAIDTILDARLWLLLLILAAFLYLAAVVHFSQRDR